MSEFIRLAVLSDIHAYDTPNGRPPSWLRASDDDAKIGQHPILSLKKLVSEEGLSADVLVCCGDLCDKAGKAGLSYVWNKLHELKADFHASQLAVTPGNHDVDSRYTASSFDAKGLLQSLTPEFPSGDEVTNDHFWSRNFFIIDDARFRLVVLNSAAYHGTKEGEFERGRVADSTLARLRKELGSMENSGRPNILICHHHPLKTDPADSGDDSTMEGGHLLLRELGEGGLGSWLILHGHRHLPGLLYGPGTSNAPVVFSAGSFSAMIYSQIQDRARNQFYLIDVSTSAGRSLGSDLVGTFRAWDWSNGRGWVPAGENSGLPACGGFGFRGSVPLLAEKIISGVGDSPFQDWHAVEQQAPEIRFLLPSDLDRLFTILQNSGFRVFKDNGMPAQLAKAAGSKTPSRD